MSSELVNALNVLNSIWGKEEVLRAVKAINAKPRGAPRKNQPYEAFFLGIEIATIVSSKNRSEPLSVSSYCNILQSRTGASAEGLRRHHARGRDRARALNGIKKQEWRASLAETIRT